MSTELIMPSLSKESQEKLADCLIEIGKTEGFIDSNGDVSKKTEDNFAFILEVVLKQEADEKCQKLQLVTSGPAGNGSFPLVGGAPRAITSLCWNWRRGWVVWR